MIKDLIVSSKTDNIILAGLLLPNLEPLEIFEELTSAAQLKNNSIHIGSMIIFPYNVNMREFSKNGSVVREKVYFKSIANTEEFKNMVISNFEHYSLKKNL